MPSKKISKKQMKMKMVLAVALAAIMFVLVAGYLLTRNRKPQKAVQPAKINQTQNEEKTSGEPVSEQTVQDTAEDGSPTADGEEAVPVTEPETQTDAGQRTAPLITDPTKEDWELSIISVKYALKDDYTPELAPALPGSEIKLDARICEAYQRMYNDAKQENCILTPYSGYLSRSYQENVYLSRVNYYVGQGMTQQEAEAEAAKRIQPAGSSEHNSGLAIDIGSASFDFEKSEEFRWLSEHAQDYGFILRYPKDKEDITGVYYQPWHWRYVGVENAQKMVQANQCLEEYLAIS